MTDIHYEWELQDAENEWQAGGSCNELADAQREGTRYLMEYSQNGAHKLIIREHRTQVVAMTTTPDDCDGKDLAACRARFTQPMTPTFLLPEPLANQIIFHASPTEEVIRLNKEGFHYKGQFIADAGEAHRLMLVFLEQNTKTKPEPPTDQEEVEELVADLRTMATHAGLACQPGDFKILTRAANMIQRLGKQEAGR
jgi:hypothetical protein